MFSSVTLFLWAVSITFTSCLSISPKPSPEEHSLSRRGTPRAVWILSDIKPQSDFVFTDGTTGFYVHSALWVAGNHVDGPFKVETNIDFSVTPMLPEYGLNLRVLDQGVKASGDVPPVKAGRSMFHVGDVDVSNKVLFDSDTKEGFVTDEFFDDPTYRTGPKFKGVDGKPSTVNDCNTFVKKMVAGLGAKLPDDAQKLLDGAERWATECPKAQTLEIEVKAVAYLDIDEHGNPRQQVLRTDAACAAPQKAKRGGTCKPRFTDEGEKPIGSSEYEIAVNDNYKMISSDDLRLDSVTDLVAEKPGVPTSIETTSFMTRAGSVLKALTAISKADLIALGGAAAAAVGAVFVLLDFINHDWVGGAIGAVGLAAGLVAGLLVTGPLGWVIGGAIAALFAILPGLFKDQHPPAKITDLQGIIQWKMFGDASHTGNEQCQQGTSDTPGNKDCQALYGPGTLATVLGFENFDAITFQIQYNLGYPMTIPDIAKAFYVIDPDKKGDGDDKIATIKCNNKKGSPAGRAGIIGGDNPSLCNHPTFAINRKLINLPVLNENADSIFNRIIPAPNGDCKLIAYPGSTSYPTYDVTVSGLPSAIACGLTSAINVNGVAVPIGDDTNGQTPQTSSNPSDDTSNQGGAFIAPPPAAPFAPLDPKDYVCLSYQGASICVPPGRYHKQSGLGFEIKNCDILTVPGSGYQLTAHWANAPNPDDPRVSLFTNHNFTTNQSPPPGGAFYSFAASMQAIASRGGDGATIIITGPSTGPDPICCLFTGTQYGGNVICLGVGGGPLPSQWQDQAQSLQCFNGGQVRLFGKEYGDSGESPGISQVDDLANQPYGNGNFAKAVKAVWIEKGQ